MRPRLKPVERQVIVITGATSGNGLAAAQLAVRRGAAVVLAARNEEVLERIAEELRSCGGRVAVCAADVAVEEDIKRIAASAIAAFGGFDSWVNDAAAAMYGSVEEVTMEDHRRTFDVNYFGLLMGLRVAVRHLRGRGGGSIVNIGLVLSDRSMILQGPYSASKHAVQAATDALRMELEREWVPINITLIKPGSIDTPYPEHARNYMGAPPRLPPPLYDPAAGGGGHSLRLREYAPPDLCRRRRIADQLRRQVRAASHRSCHGADRRVGPAEAGRSRGALRPRQSLRTAVRRAGSTAASPSGCAAPACSSRRRPGR